MTATATVTAPAPAPSRPGASPTPARAPGPTSAARAPGLVVALLLVTVLGQRLAVPVAGIEVQLTLVAGLTGFALLLHSGQVRADRLRLELYLLAAAACSLAALAATWSGGPLSLPSWAVLLALYLPWAYRLRDPHPAAHRHLGHVYVRLMLALSGVAVAQLGAQLAGVWSYSDVLGSRLPPALLVSGYNTSIPLQFGAVVHKSNAGVFLEPSFLSQFCALALLVGLVLRVPLWQLALLGAGLVSAVSGTGLLLLAGGLVLLALRDPRALRPSVLTAGAVGLAAVLASPVGAVLLARRGEIGRAGSSGSSRFVAPYVEAAQGLAAEPLRYLTGAGPGTATRLLESSARGQLGDAVVYNIPTKLVFEYGVPAGLLFTALIVVGLLWRVPGPVVPAALLVMLFVLSGSLLQPHTVVLAWLLTTLWAAPPRTAPPTAAPAHPARPG